MLAGELVDRFAVEAFRMRMPPGKAAFRGAEPPGHPTVSEVTAAPFTNPGSPRVLSLGGAATDRLHRVA